jgi:putative zinc finger/helix-turn-helix YgiT family protein
MSRKQSCPVCSGTDITVHPEMRSFRAPSGEEIPYRAEYSRCGRCGEEFLTYQQSRAANRNLAGVERQRGGRLTPNEIIAIRNSYGVTQEQIERILRVGKKTWGRWESGLVCQSRAADQLLREIRDSPSLFKRLAEQAGVTLPEPVELDAWAHFEVSYTVLNDHFHVTATSLLPTRQRVGPLPPPEASYATIDWAEVLVPTYVAEPIAGARVNQNIGSASPELLAVA